MTSGPRTLVADVEIVVGEPAALRGENPVIGVLAGVFRHGDAKAGTLLHALEDEIDAVGVLPRHAALPGQNMIFLVSRHVLPHIVDLWDDEWQNRWWPQRLPARRSVATAAATGS
jgi:hypothetical protein